MVKGGNKRKSDGAKKNAKDRQRKIQRLQTQIAQLRVVDADYLLKESKNPKTRQHLKSYLEKVAERKDIFKAGLVKQAKAVLDKYYGRLGPQKSPDTTKRRHRPQTRSQKQKELNSDEETSCR